MIKVLASTGSEDVAKVYVCELGGGKYVECVEALKPPFPRREKWILLVSTMFGCPVGCAMCDAGGFFRGTAAAEEIFAQIDFLVRKHFPDGNVDCRQFKIQFARMGEPSLNAAVLDVLCEFPERYAAPGFIPSISTVAPRGTDAFFERLLSIKNEKYAGGRFQLQFSLHTTDEKLRDFIIPVKKWSFDRIAEYGERFFSPGDRKITLNFALMKGKKFDPDGMRRHFDPEKFLVKMTPLNPTLRSEENGLISRMDPDAPEGWALDVEALRRAGYDVIVSVGNPEENLIGSNCGQFLRTFMLSGRKVEGGYKYKVVDNSPVRS